jgi:hypothetical protein
MKLIGIIFLIKNTFFPQQQLKRINGMNMNIVDQQKLSRNRKPAIDECILGVE